MSLKLSTKTERHLLDEGSQKPFSIPFHQASKNPWHLGGLCGPFEAGTLVEKWSHVFLSPTSRPSERETSVWIGEIHWWHLGPTNWEFTSFPSQSVFYAPPFVPFQENHWQTFAEVYNPAFSHKIMVPTQTLKPMVMNERKIIARRAAMESRAREVFFSFFFWLGGRGYRHAQLPLTYTLQKGLAHWRTHIFVGSCRLPSWFSENCFMSSVGRRSSLKGNVFEYSMIFCHVLNSYQLPK